ncbi:MAG TPA: transglutaminase family protein [Bryobacteraceae bacterium]|nr:transglutaminase family protein [Bryobacteraceae bacterium]
MKIQVGYEMVYGFAQATPMVLMLHVHDSRAADMEVPDDLITDPPVALSEYRDSFGNRCTRLVAPAGRITIWSRGLIRDSGELEVPVTTAEQHPVQDLPEETLVFLLGSRYCETELLSQTAWNLFGNVTPGWARVQAICDFVHQRIAFSYQNARSTRTAWETYNEGTGVCRDFTHLAVTLCRCMNIPARYCTGYLGDMGTPPPYGAMDFAACFEAYIGGAWRTFDPRNNVPRIGRTLIARGRDAADVAIATSFGPHSLERFTVYADEI